MRRSPRQRSRRSRPHRHERHRILQTSSERPEGSSRGVPPSPTGSATSGPSTPQSLVGLVRLRFNHRGSLRAHRWRSKPSPGGSTTAKALAVVRQEVGGRSAQAWPAGSLSRSLRRGSRGAWPRLGRGTGRQGRRQRRSRAWAAARASGMPSHTRSTLWSLGFTRVAQARRGLRRGPRTQNRG